MMGHTNKNQNYFDNDKNDYPAKHYEDLRSDIVRNLDSFYNFIRCDGSLGPIKISSRIKARKRYESKVKIYQSLNGSTDDVTINDIVGTRIIFNSLRDCVTFKYFLEEQASKIFQIISQKDYIHNPKEYGYRSLHLIVRPTFYLKYDSEKLPFDQTTTIEIQLRTKLQHFFSKLTYWRHNLSRSFPFIKHWPIIDIVLNLISKLLYAMDSIH